MTGMAFTHVRAVRAEMPSGIEPAKEFENNISSLRTIKSTLHGKKGLDNSILLAGKGLGWTAVSQHSLETNKSRDAVGNYAGYRVD